MTERAGWLRPSRAVATSRCSRRPAVIDQEQEGERERCEADERMREMEVTRTEYERGRLPFRDFGSPGFSGAVSGFLAALDDDVEGALARVTLTGRGPVFGLNQRADIETAAERARRRS